MHRREQSALRSAAATGLGLVLLGPHIDQHVILRGHHVQSLCSGQVTFVAAESERKQGPCRRQEQVREERRSGDHDVVRGAQRPDGLHRRRRDGLRGVDDLRALLRRVRDGLSGGQNGGGVDAGALERLRGLLGGAGDHRRGELQRLLAGALQRRQGRLRGLAQRLEHAGGLLGHLAADADDLVHRVHHLGHGAGDVLLGERRGVRGRSQSKQCRRNGGGDRRGARWRAARRGPCGRLGWRRRRREDGRHRKGRHGFASPYSAAMFFWATHAGGLN